MPSCIIYINKFYLILSQNASSEVGKEEWATYYISSQCFRRYEITDIFPKRKV